MLLDYCSAWRALMRPGLFLPPFKHNNFWIRVFTCFLLVTFITLAATSYFQYYYFSHLFEDEILDLNQRILDQVYNHSEDYIMKNMNELANNISFSNSYDTNVDQFFYELYDNYWDVLVSVRHKLKNLVTRNADIVDSIYLYSKENEMVISQDIIRYVSGKDLRLLDEFSWIGIALSSGESVQWLNTRITKVYNSALKRKGNIITLVSTYPTASHPDNAKGFIAINIREDAISSYLSKSNSTKSGQILIVGTDKTIISHNDNSMLYTDITKEPFIEEIIASDKPKDFRASFGNKEYMVSFRPSEYNDWYYVAMVPTELFYQRGYHIRKNILIISIAIFFFVLIISNILSYKMYQPVKKLMDRENNFMKNSQKIIRSYFIDLLSKQPSDNALTQSNLQSFGVSLSERYFAVIAFILPEADINYYARANLLHAPDGLTDFIKGMSRNGADEKTSYYPVVFDPCTISVIVNTNSSSCSRLREFVNQVQFYCYNSFSFYLVAGIGRYENQLMSVRQSYIEAKIAVHYKFMKPEQNSFYYDEISRKTTDSEVLMHGYLDKIKMQLRAGDIKKLRSTLESALMAITSENLSYTYVKKEVSKLRRLYFEHLDEMGITIGQVFEEDSDSLGLPSVELRNNLLNPDNIYTFFHAYTIALERLTSCLLKKRAHKSTELIKSVEQYILSNINLNISLNLVADTFHITPQYLSKIFKEEKGVNYIDYVTICKMEKAKSLLSATNMNVIEIANAVGYSQGTNFARKFKESTGFTPKEYRLNEARRYLKEASGIKTDGCVTRQDRFAPHSP